MEASKSLKKIKSNLSWKKVFEFWKKNELRKGNYKETYKNRGFKNWEEWRSAYSKYLKLDKYKWNLYKITDPAEIIPDFYGGPFPTWVEKIYDGKKTMKFKKIIEKRKIIRNEKIKRIIDRNKGESTMIGIVKKEKIIVIEGLHRCCAVSLMNKKNLDINFSLNIALTRYDERLKTFKKFYKKDLKNL